MNRSLAALCVLSLATPSIAGVSYSNDNRFVQAVNSFGQSVAHTPPIAFGPFHETSQVNTDMAEGSCGSIAMHDSQMNSALMSGTGSVNANSSTKAATPLVFAGSGNSRFEVGFKPDASGVIHLTGQFAGTAGKSSFLAELKLGDTVLFSKASSGSFDIQSAVYKDSQYKLTVYCASNSLLMWSGTPATASSTANFSFNASVSSSLCVGDLNLDGVVDDLDFTIFVLAYNLLDCADPTMPAGCPADLNRDGVVDDIDFTIFVPAYNDLICP